MQIVDLVSKLPVHPKKKPDLRKFSEIKKIALHTTDWDITPEALAQYDIGPNHISSSGCPTITYSYLVQKDGTVCKTANEDVVTWHVGNHNRSCLGVSLVYKTDPAYESGKVKTPTPGKLPTVSQMDSAKELLAALCLKFRLPPSAVVGHRELEGTGWFWQKGHRQLRKTCPGMAIDMDLIRRELAGLMQQVLKDKGLYTGTVDGIWGPKSQKALEGF